MTKETKPTAAAASAEAPSSAIRPETFRDCANLAFRVSAISFGVSAANMPFSILLTMRQMRVPGTIGQQTMYGLARFLPTMPSYVLAGQTKGALSVTGKTISSSSGEAPAPGEPAPLRESVVLPAREKFVLGLVFAQVEAVGPSYFANKAKLISAGYKVGPCRSLDQLLKLTFTGYPLRFMACGANYATLLAVSDKFASLVPLKNEFAANLLGGFLAGGFNCLATLPLNHFHDQQILRTTKRPDGTFKVVPSVSFFKQVWEEYKTLGVKHVFKGGSPGLRFASSATTFGMIQALGGVITDDNLKAFLALDSVGFFDNLRYDLSDWSCAEKDNKLKLQF